MTERIWRILVESFPKILLPGLRMTLPLTAIAFAIAMVIAIVVAMIQFAHVKVLTQLSRFYIWVIRGTPLLVQAYFIYFGVTGVLGIRMSAFTAGVIALSLNAGGYMSEIFRGGIQAVDPGQREAARSLGLSASQTTWRIIIPQAIRICIPSVVNQWCITIKDTSIICVIGLAELTRAGQTIIARNYRAFEMWIMVGALYLLVIYLLTVLSRIVERKVSLD